MSKYEQKLAKRRKREHPVFVSVRKGKTMIGLGSK